MLAFGAPKRPIYVNFKGQVKIISRHNLVDLRVQKFLEAHRLPEFGFVAVSFVLVVVEIIMGVGVGGGVRVGGQGVGWE